MRRNAVVAVLAAGALALLGTGCDQVEKAVNKGGDTPCSEYTAQSPDDRRRSEEHTSELQSLMRISYAVFCLKKKKINQKKENERKRSNRHTIQNEYKKRG